MPFFRRKKQLIATAYDYLDTPLLSWSGADAWTIRAACEGLLVLGGVGSGKTSGSGHAVARAFLESGFGGIVLTAKTTETDLWRDYCQRYNRLRDLIVFSAQSPYRFNFLEYERTRSGSGAGLTQNMTELLMTICEAGKRGGGGSNEDFWKNEQTKAFGQAIDLLKLAQRPVSMTHIKQVLITAATSMEETNDPKWQQKSFCYRCIVNAHRRKETGKMSAMDAGDYGEVFSYWMEEFPAFDERPRSTVMSSVTGVMSGFLKGHLRELFCTTTNLTPEATFDGKIIVLDLPQKDFGAVGIWAQVLFKYMWQRAIEQRDIRRHPLPCFCWVDEAHNFYIAKDFEFQASAREKRGIPVYLSQNIPNYYAALAGEKDARSVVDSFFGNITTKIFHNNNCHVTNEWAAKLFARDWTVNTNTNYAPKEQGLEWSLNESRSMEYQLPPIAFTRLRKGGPSNDFQVEGYVHQGGQCFAHSGVNSLQTIFAQHP